MAPMGLRTVALVGVLGVAAGWALAGRGGLLAPSPAPAVSRGARPLGVETPAAFGPSTRELRRKLEQHALPPRPVRNPFTFAPRPAPSTDHAATPETHPTPAAVPATEGTPAAEPMVPYRLAGIATSGDGEAAERTAVLSGGAAVLLVKKGDAVPGGWTVADVRDGAVVLVDTAGSQHIVRLP